MTLRRKPERRNLQKEYSRKAKSINLERPQGRDGPNLELDKIELDGHKLIRICFNVTSKNF